MKFFLAPMQGLTGYTVRNAFHHNFDYIDKYYTPFIPAAKRMNAKIKRDIDPVNNDGITLIPQAMSIVADEVIDLHRQLVPYGYDEININLGCPSGTVVSKKRGSGILAYPDMLDSFLDELYTKADYKAKVDGNDADSENEMTPEDQKSALITRGLGGKKNISDVDCCATRLRCTVVKPELVNEDVLRMTSPSGIVRKGQGIQVIYGPAVSVIKSNLEDYLEKAPDVEYLPKENENSAEETNKYAETKDEAKKDENKTVAAGTVKKELCSPFTGVAAPIEEACDEAFAGKMMGDGYLVRPEEGMAYAPEDATVSFIFPSKHAVGLTSDDGTEYLLHIGVDTVNLDGKGFETFVNDGDRVKKGDKLIGFDIKYIQEHAKSDECMIVFTSLQEGEEIRMSKSGKVEKLEKTAEIVSLN